MAKVYVKEIRDLKNLQLVNFQIEFSMKTGLHIIYTQLHLTFIEQILEQKIYSLQEELTNLHRRKGEHAQQIVDLTSKLQETEKNLSLKESL